MRSTHATLTALLIMAAPLAAQDADAPIEGGRTAPSLSFFGGGGALFDDGFHGSPGAHVYLAVDAPLSAAFSGRVEGVVATTGRGLSALALVAWSPFRSGALGLLAGGGLDYDHLRSNVQVLGAEVAVAKGGARLFVRRIFGMDDDRALVGLALGL